MSMRLNVEAILKAGSNVRSKSMTAHIKEELLKREVLRIGSKITNFQIEILQEYIEAIYICEADLHGLGTVVDSLPEEGSSVNASEVSLSIYIYRLNGEGSVSEPMGGEDDQTTAATHCMLPASVYHGLWDSLIFDSDIKQQLLQYARAMLHLSKVGVDTQLISCNRVVLLHGPPGTGKTSLCKALAQRLAVRMSASFPQAVLVEINTHGLFSKYFSESGKLVSRLFSKLAELSDDPRTLLIVLVDEVESLAHSRASCAANEPSDAIRVVNALLTHIDLLKERHNVLVLTTSNITGAIDIAFVDRADIRAYIPNPSIFAIYAIYVSCIQDLIRVGMVIGTCPEKINDRKHLTNGQNEQNGEQVENTLISLARSSEGLTGRSLRKVPLRVFSKQLPPERVVKLEEFLSAMSVVIGDMKREQVELSQQQLQV